jgi:hypothetical protein
MSSVSLRNDTLIEISTFLVRRWSENDQITVEFSTKKTNETRKKENRIILIPFLDYNGELPYGMRQCELITVVKFYQTIMPLDLFLIL